MANVAINAKKRQKNTKAGLANIRRAGNVPAIIYGLEKEPVLIELVASELRAPLSNRNKAIDLNVEGQVETVLIKVVDRDPIRKDLVHIDFLRVNDDRPVVVVVPVITHGMPYGVKTEGGVFSVMKKNVKLRAKLQDVPDNFDLDVSEMKSGVIFYVRDLKFAKGTFVTPGKTALFGVTTGRAEEEAAPTAAPAAAAPAADAKKEAPKKDAKKK